MASSKISELVDGTNFLPGDATIIVRNGANFKVDPTKNAVNAWVNFNGTGTVAIRASYNVSSITDAGTGTYTANFTNALTDADYSYAPGIGDVPLDCNVTVKNLSTSSIEIYVYRIPTSALTDASQVSIAIIR